jgi:hypothetical protein
MCLVNSVKGVKELLGTKKKTFRFYKVVNRSEDSRSLRSLWHYDYIWKVGINVSTTRAKKVCLRTTTFIDHGIHVFRTLKRAKLEKDDRYNSDAKILEVLCDKVDLLGASETEAVFRKVRVSRRSYKNALQ